MIRLFVALELPEDVRQRLAGLCGGVPGARWTDIENFHLTLRFIGEVENGTAEDIDAALQEVHAPAFDLVLDGVGQFGQGRGARILWAGVERNDSLTRLAHKVESALVRIGLPPEERKYSPHVTLARLKGAPVDRLGRFAEEYGLFRSGPIPIRHFTLFQSRPGNGGPVYIPLSRYPLAKDPAG